jgi:hypothetical protein
MDCADAPLGFGEGLPATIEDWIRTNPLLRSIGEGLIASAPVGG